MDNLWTAITSIPGVGPFIPYITAAITLCAAISTALPPPDKNGTAYWWVYSAINWIALNLGHAKNATAPITSSNGDTEHA